jgi:hypothetical protein
MTQVFVDMDGVLADFDTGHHTFIGSIPCKTADNVDWDQVSAYNGFYANLPPMPDFQELWSGLIKYNPIVLTGVPRSVPSAVADKREWLDKYTGADTRMIACKSAEKSLHMTAPGDIIIDDWEKYKHIWVKRGGRWITHTSAAESLRQLEELMNVT